MENSEKRLPYLVLSVLAEDEQGFIKTRPEERKSFSSGSQLRTSSLFIKGMEAYERMIIPVAPSFFTTDLPVIIPEKDITLSLENGVVRSSATTGDISTTGITAEHRELTRNIQASFSQLRLLLSTVMIKLSGEFPDASKVVLDASKGDQWRLLKWLWYYRSLMVNRLSVYPDDITNLAVLTREVGGLIRTSDGLVITQKSNFYDTSGDIGSPFHTKYVVADRVPALGLYQTHPITLTESIRAFYRSSQASEITWISDNHWMLNKLDTPMQFMVNMGRNARKSASLNIPKFFTVPSSFTEPDLRRIKLITWRNSKIFFGYSNYFLQNRAAYDSIAGWNDKRPIDSIIKAQRVLSENGIVLKLTDFVNGASNRNFTAAELGVTRAIANSLMISDNSYRIRLGSGPMYDSSMRPMMERLIMLLFFPDNRDKLVL